MKRTTGFTLVESLISIVVIIILVSILTPVFAAAKRRSQIISSTSKLHQLHLGLELYRSTFSGGESYDFPKSYYTLGLPRWRFWNPTTFGVNDSFMESPCGADMTVHQSNGLTSIPGWIQYSAAFFDPEIFTNGSNYRWLFYLREYRENSVMFIDPFCNPSGTKMGRALLRKRGLGVTISGQLTNQFKTGDITDLRWYSDKPD